MSRVKVLLPQFGMGMQDAEIVRWLKQIGDSVEAGEPLAEIEAAKTNAELLSPARGVLTEILCLEGDVATVRSHIATLEV